MPAFCEAVAGLLLRNGVTPTFRQIALPDAFLDAGALPTLHDRYGISRRDPLDRFDAVDQAAFERIAALFCAGSD